MHTKQMLKLVKKITVYKVKFVILSKSANRKFINSHLPSVKYFMMITLKSDI